MTIAYRTALSSDRRFVVSAWSSSYKSANAAGMIWHEDWSTIMHGQIEKLLDRPGIRTAIAYENTDPDFVYGFICGDTPDEPPVVMYVYVKEPYRKAGNARGMFAELGFDPRGSFVYACRTAVVSRLADKIPRARWSPEVARYPRNNREQK